MRPQNAEPASFQVCRPFRLRQSRGRIGPGFCCSHERCLNISVGDAHQRAFDLLQRAKCRQALLRVVAVPFDVHIHQRIESGELFRGQSALLVQKRS